MNTIEKIEWSKLPKSTGWYFGFTETNKENASYMIKKIHANRFEGYMRSTIPGLWNFVTAGLTLQRTKNQMTVYHNAIKKEAPE